MPSIIHAHKHHSIRCLFLVLFTAMLLVGCGSRSSPPNRTEQALVDQLVAQLHLEQCQRAELERQLEFDRQLQYVEVVVLILLGGALSVCLVVLLKRRNHDAS